MRILTTIAILFILNLGFGQTTEHSLAERPQGKLFMNMKYSFLTDRFFVADQSGKVTIINGRNDAILATIQFTDGIGGFIQLDNSGIIGAFCGYDDIIRFFDQNTLEIIDEVKIPNNTKGLTYQAWFTKSGILIGNNLNNYSYKLNSGKPILIKALDSFRILDYSYQSNKFLFGKWDASMSVAYKIRSLYVGTSNGVEKKVMDSKSYFKGESGAYFLSEGSKIVAHDLAGVRIFDGDHTYAIGTEYGTVRAIAKVDDDNIFLSTVSRQKYGITKFNVNDYEVEFRIGDLKYPPYTNNIFEINTSLFAKKNSNKIYTLNIHDGLKSNIIVIQ